MFASTIAATIAETTIKGGAAMSHMMDQDFFDWYWALPVTSHKMVKCTDMGRLADGELSQSKRAIKWRANKALRNAAIALEKQGAELIIEGEQIVPPKKTTQPSPDAIGVFTPDPQPVEPEPVEAQGYHCNNCQGTVHQGDEACGVCEQRLNWAGLG